MDKGIEIKKEVVWTFDEVNGKIVFLVGLYTTLGVLSIVGLWGMFQLNGEAKFFAWTYLILGLAMILCTLFYFKREVRFYCKKGVSK